MTSTPTPTPRPPVQADEAEIVASLHVLVDGDRCDTGDCGALAYVRVYMLNPDTQDHIGVLHFCGHHFAPLEGVFVAKTLAGECGYVDERDRLMQRQ